MDARRREAALPGEEGGSGADRSGRNGNHRSAALLPGGLQPGAAPGAALVREAELPGRRRGGRRSPALVLLSGRERPLPAILPANARRWRRWRRGQEEERRDAPLGQEALVSEEEEEGGGR